MKRALLVALVLVVAGVVLIALADRASAGPRMYAPTVEGKQTAAGAATLPAAPVTFGLSADATVGANWVPGRKGFFG